jgi:subtilisin family serine protease
VRGRGLVLGLGAVAAAGLTAVAGSAASGAQAPTDRFGKVSSSFTTGAKMTPAALGNKQVTVMLQLPDNPVAVAQAQAAQQGKQFSQQQRDTLRAQIKARQDSIRGAIQSAGAAVVAQLQDAYDGILVRAPRSAVASLRSVPGVSAVRPVQTFKPTNVHSIPFVGAPQVWGGVPGATGKGEKIAMIDSGIDYTHADFGGPGTAAAFAAADAADTQPADPTMFGPAAPKVKGGFDFVGDAYDADDPAHSTPQPDPNPLDCTTGSIQAHGTHTSGTAAGFGVLSNGTTFHGPYDADTVASHSWNIGPGAAPEADIYAYRVFGCSGTTQVVSLAINQAVKDGVNVISMSLGSPFGREDDPTTVAANNAAAAGIAVVASAGNESNNAFTVGSPSTGSRVISVAANDANETFPGATIATPGGAITAIDANGAALPSGPIPVVVLRNADGSVSLGCAGVGPGGAPIPGSSPTEFTDQHVAGKIVVVLRGNCARVAKAINGQKAGAAAVVMLNTSPGLPPFEGKITSNPDTGEPFDVTIPFLGVAGCYLNTGSCSASNDSNDAETLVAADGQTATLASVALDNPGFRAIVGFSSGGPRAFDDAPKPDITAPGVSVTSAAAGTGNQGKIVSGTSQAAPAVSGSAALLLQLHPTWTPDQVKAALMNTADPTQIAHYDPRLAGAGLTQVQRAAATSVLAMTADHLNSLAFGYIPGSSSFSATKSFTVSNTGTSAVSYAFSAAPAGPQLGATIGISPGSVNVPAGGTATVNVTLSIPASAFAALPGASLFAAGNPGPGGLVNAAGAIVGTPSGGGTVLRVPYLFAPRGLSSVSATTPNRFTPTRSSSFNFAATSNLRNAGIHSGDADLYAWGIHDPQGDGTTVPDNPLDVRDVGIQVLPGSVLGGTDADRTLVFAVNMYGRTANASENEIDVAINVDSDPAPDFFVVGADLGNVFLGDVNGQFVAFVVNATTGDIVSDARFADAPMNGSTVELPLLASEIGLSATGRPHNVVGSDGPLNRLSGVGAIDYWVNAFSNTTIGNSEDDTSHALFDVFRPAVSSGDFATLGPGASGSFQLGISIGDAVRQHSLGWLVVTLDDANGGAQADEVSASAAPGVR